jgi:putative membrane protein
MIIRWLLVWLINAAAVYAAAYLVDGIFIKSVASAFIVALALGFVNTIVRPIVVFFSLPAIALTLGLFLFIINALMLLLVSLVVPNFEVRGFWTAVLGSVVISVVSFFLSFILRINEK